MPLLPLSLLFPFLFGIISHLPIYSMLLFCCLSASFFPLVFLFPHLHFSSCSSMLPLQCTKPRMALQDTKRESMVSVSKDLQTNRGKNSAMKHVKIEANRGFLSSFFVFFPCAILGFKYVFQLKYGQERLWHSAASFPDITGRLSASREGGLTFVSYFLLS